VKLQRKLFQKALLRKLNNKLNHDIFIGCRDLLKKNKEMKSVTNKELISIILINIGILAVAVYSWLLYNRIQTIINSEEPIQNYSVLEVYCRGRSTSSSILIEFNGKQYYVGIARDKCIQFDPQKIKLFYDKERDEVYEEGGLSIRHVVACFILYLCSCIWLFVVIKKRLSSS
jgi:hypothetical protein